jgi:hypothetical protein
MSSPNGFTAAAVAPSTNGAGARPTAPHRSVRRETQ